MLLRQALMDCNRRNALGQATVEYAIVIGSLLVITITLASLWHFFSDQTMVQRVFMHVGHGLPYALFDILKY